MLDAQRSKRACSSSESRLRSPGHLDGKGCIARQRHHAILGRQPQVPFDDGLPRAIWNLQFNGSTWPPRKRTCAEHIGVYLHRPISIQGHSVPNRAVIAHKPTTAPDLQSPRLTVANFHADPVARTLRKASRWYPTAAGPPIKSASPECRVSRPVQASWNRATGALD